MIIKKLELHGFKSFPEKTKILFHPGITAITGPNGTGKSNIVDALLWVLGGKRFKFLRGERSSDIIFNGHENKPPLSLADVNLFIGDDDEDIIINHRLFRSGESEYRLNGKLSRLKDIQDCLWKKAIGELKYFVIEQGSIGLFLSSKSTEKRLLLEEAAGTAYYKDKKIQAEYKLQSSEQNLTRLEDIISEVSKAKNSLKRQADAASRYRKFRDQIRTLTSLSYRKRIDDLEKSQKDATQHYERFLSRENQTLSLMKDEEKSLTLKRQEVWSLEQTIKQDQENLYTLKSTLSKLEANKEENSRNISFLEEQKEKVKKNRKELAQELGSLDKKDIEAATNLKDFEKSLHQKQKAMDEASQAIQRFQKEKAHLQKNTEALKKDLFQKLHLSTETKNEKAKFDKESELILHQREKLKIQLEKEKAMLKNGENKINSITEEIVQDHKSIEEIKREISLDREKLEKLSDSLEILHEKLADLRTKKEKESHHLQLLQNIEEKERGPDIEKHIPGAMGILADLVESDPEYAHLIDIFWDEEAKATIIQPQDFLKILGKTKVKGNFLLLHPDKKKEAPSKTKKDARIVGDLKSSLRFHPKIKSFIPCLREASIVEDVKSAVELWLKSPSQNFITPQGDLLQSSGLLKLGEKKEGFFALVQEIRNKKETISRIEKDIQPLKNKIEEKTKTKLRLEEDTKKKSDCLARQEDVKEEKEKDMALIRSEKEKTALNMSILENELKIILDDKNQIDQRLANIALKLKEREEEEEEVRQRLQSVEEAFEEHQEKIEDKRKYFFELKSDIDLLNEKIKNTKLQIHSFQQRRENIKNRDVSLDQEIKTAEKKQAQFKKDVQHISKEIKDMESEKRNKETQLSQNEALLKKLQKEQREKEERIEQFREDYEERKEERVEWEIKKAEKDRDLANLEESCWQELKKSIEEIKKEINLDMLKDMDVQAKLDKAEEKLQKIKAVNLMAEEEYLSQKKRYDFLIQQKKDLRESIDTTKVAIKKIDQESKSQFMNALTEVNNNFQEVFSLLFNGGKAQLKLTDENIPLESGVDIIAQPPGKRLQSITLLSGGEKSLTSLAFFFALFRYKPTPFCVLDEVDAALDENNLERFLNLMRKIKTQTQFILITHNFKTMEVADYIYGTTMAEPNITTLYSVKIDKKQLV